MDFSHYDDIKKEMDAIKLASDKIRENMEIPAEDDLTKKDIDEINSKLRHEPPTPYEKIRNKIEKEEDDVRAKNVEQFKINSEIQQKNNPFFSYYIPGMLTGSYLICGGYVINPLFQPIILITSPIVGVLEVITLPITLSLMAWYRYKKSLLKKE